MRVNVVAIPPSSHGVPGPGQRSTVGADVGATEVREQRRAATTPSAATVGVAVAVGTYVLMLYRADSSFGIDEGNIVRDIHLRSPLLGSLTDGSQFANHLAASMLGVLVQRTTGSAAAITLRQPSLLLIAITTGLVAWRLRTRTSTGLALLGAAVIATSPIVWHHSRELN